MTTVYITAPREAGEAIANTLVEERLAACVNRTRCDSIYRWEGEIHDDEEVILLAKTTEAAYDALVDRVVELHPYDVPCIERFDESVVWPLFARWREQVVD